MVSLLDLRSYRFWNALFQQAPETVYIACLDLQSMACSSNWCVEDGRSMMTFFMTQLLGYHLAWCVSKIVRLPLASYGSTGFD